MYQQPPPRFAPPPQYGNPAPMGYNPNLNMNMNMMQHQRPPQPQPQFGRPPVHHQVSEKIFFFSGWTSGKQCVVFGLLATLNVTIENGEVYFSQLTVGAVCDLTIRVTIELFVCLPRRKSVSVVTVNSVATTWQPCSALAKPMRPRLPRTATAATRATVDWAEETWLQCWAAHWVVRQRIVIGTGTVFEAMV